MLAKSPKGVLKIDKPNFVKRLEEYGCLAWSVYQFSNDAWELVFVIISENQKINDNKSKKSTIRLFLWESGGSMFSIVTLSEEEIKKEFTIIKKRENMLNKNKPFAKLLIDRKGKEILFF